MLNDGRHIDQIRKGDFKNEEVETKNFTDLQQSMSFTTDVQETRKSEDIHTTPTVACNPIIPSTSYDNNCDNCEKRTQHSSLTLTNVGKILQSTADFGR